MSAFLNVGSFILGLLSWAIPVVAMRQKRWAHNDAGFCLVSFAACALALIMQIFEMSHRAHIGDWSAILDTIDAVGFAAVTLAAVAIFLNALALKRRKHRQDA